MKRNSYSLAIHQRRRRGRVRASIVNGDLRAPFELAAMRDGLELIGQARRELERHVEAVAQCGGVRDLRRHRYVIQVTVPEAVRHLGSIAEVKDVIQRQVFMELVRLAQSEAPDRHAPHSSASGGLP